MKSKVAEAIRILAGIEPTMFIVGVASDIQARTCTVTPLKPEGGVEPAEIKNVRLNTHISGEGGLIIKPKDGTYVIAALLTPTDAIVIGCYEIESIDITIGATTVSIKDGEILLNGGDNGGLVIAPNMVEKVNLIETKVNDIINTLKAVVIPLAPSGTYALAADFGTMAVLQETEVADIENDKIKH